MRVEPAKIENIDEIIVRHMLDFNDEMKKLMLASLKLYYRLKEIWSLWTCG